MGKPSNNGADMYVYNRVDMGRFCWLCTVMDTWDNSNKLTHPGHSPLDLQVVLFCTLSQKLDPQLWRTKIGRNFLESFQLEIQAQMFSQALFLMSTEEGQLAIIETNIVKGKLYFEQWLNTMQLHCWFQFMIWCDNIGNI